MPVAGNLGRPNLRRDVVEPSQCGENHQQPFLYWERLFLLPRAKYGWVIGNWSIYTLVASR